MNSRPPPSKPSDQSRPPAPAAPPPLFRRIDWWALGICFAIVATIYFLTLAPEVTLEDSGELTTGSFWAGIPHPPGYPFWTIYTWLWTVLVPFGNVAWRVELAEAAAAAMGCSLIAFMVSRGSSMLIESIADLKGIARPWENAICLVCGVTAGLLMALDNSMWKESVAINRISLFGVPWLVVVLLSLLRWIYAPHQRKYLYCAMFFFGICATIHQTLMVAAMGLEIGIAYTQPKLGRDMLLCNSLVWVIGRVFIMNAAALTPMVVHIFDAVGVGSIIGCLCLAIATRGLATEWKACLLMLLLWAAGASFYFYEAIAGMTNPPMEWGYPRTVEGFWRALLRGQYDRINPTDIFANPHIFVIQLEMLVKGVADAFNWVYMFFAALPFLFFFKMQKRERHWIVAVAAIYPFLGVLLTVFLNPSRERQSADLLRVFFAASHTVVAILIGYGLALTAAYVAAQYERFRRWGLVGGAMALVLACYCLMDATGRNYFGLAWEGNMSLGDLPHWIARSFAPAQYGLPVFGNLLLLLLPIIFIAALLLNRTRAPLLIVLALFSVMPLTSGLSHWFHSEQRNHWFGYWFGHDMFTPPFPGPDGKLTYDANLREQAMKGTNAAMIYPEMARDAVVYGGTDPGRFCPTYMIFCESFIPHRCQPDQDQTFNRRDCYLITQNAVADPTYLDYVRAQYNRSAQTDPPFFQNFLPESMPKIFHGDLAKVSSWCLSWLDDIFENIGAKVEWRRRTKSSWFKESDFTDIEKLAAQLRPGPQQDDLSKFLHQKLSPATQSMLQGRDDSALRRALADDFNVILRGASIYQADRFKNITLPPLIQKAVLQPQTPATTVRLNRRMLEEAYPAEIARSLGGVYPDTEIHVASLDELKAASNEYSADASRRFIHDRNFPNEPHQIKPGEDVRLDANGGISFGGTIVVMGINGYVTKVMFDKNPDHEFYVEESYPMEWMYPYLSPFGVIMKVNHQPVGELTDEAVARDHNFWSQYSKRMVGNWITYDTSIKEICDFVDKVYLRHDYAGFKGDPKFIRDDDAQKSFSKLRTAIGESIYRWHERTAKTPQERARMLKEADFALKQAFAFCPYSEAVFRLVQLLLDTGRLDDAILVAKTCVKLDPYNQQMQGMVEGLENSRKPQAPVTADMVFQDVSLALRSNQTNQAMQILDQLFHSPQADAPLLMRVAQYYVQMRNLPKTEEVLEKVTQLAPNVSVNWYNLAGLQSAQGNAAAASASLQKAFTLNEAERAADPRILDIRANARTNPNFGPIRQSPEFRALFPK